MLGVGRYLLGVIEIGFIAGFAWLGAGAVRKRIVPELGGAAGQLATAILAMALLLWMAELLGTVGRFEAGPYLFAVTIVGLGLWLLVGGRWGRPSGLLGFSPDESAVVRERGMSLGYHNHFWEFATMPDGRPARAASERSPQPPGCSCLLPWWLLLSCLLT